jgi:hypothetical protein
MAQHLLQRTDGLLASLLYPGPDVLYDQLSDVAFADASWSGMTTVCAALCHPESRYMSTIGNNNPSRENVPVCKHLEYRSGHFG